MYVGMYCCVGAGCNGRSPRSSHATTMSSPTLIRPCVRRVRLLSVSSRVHAYRPTAIPPPYLNICVLLRLHLLHGVRVILYERIDDCAVARGRRVVCQCVLLRLGLGHGRRSVNSLFKDSYKSLTHTF